MTGAATGSDEPGAADKEGEIRKQLKEDPQLLALHISFSQPAFITSACQYKIVWAQVKGHPWWPVRWLSCFVSSGRVYAFGGAAQIGSAHCNHTFCIKFIVCGSSWPGRWFRAWSCSVS